LTRSKQEADPFLTWVLFDLTRRDFFLTQGEKIEKLAFLGEIFQAQTQSKYG